MHGRACLFCTPEEVLRMSVFMALVTMLVSAAVVFVVEKLHLRSRRNP